MSKRLPSTVAHDKANASMAPTASTLRVALLPNGCVNRFSFLIELSADMPTFRKLKAATVPPAGEQIQIEISSRALSRLQKALKPVGGSQ
jgi:hypothetical protein